MMENRKRKPLDMLHGSIWNKLPLFALPVAATAILEQLFNASDIAVVGNFTGTGKTIAVAAVVSNAVSSVLLFCCLVKTKELIRVEWKKLRIDRKILGQIMRIGLPAGIQSAVFAFANIVIQSAINSLGTVVMAASSAAYNIEIFAYDILNSFSQACTTFVGQNYGAGQIKRCRKVLILCIVEDAIATACAIVLILLTGKALLSVFNNDSEVISVGYTRLIMVFSAYTFSMLYENMSGYMRGFGFSLIPAIVTTLGICGVRIFWIMAVFPLHKTFDGILTAYPVSLSVTALLIFLVLVIYHPSKRFQTDKGEM